MSKPRDDRQKDLLLPALDQIIDMGHPLVRLPALIDWKLLDERFGSVCQTGPGQPGLPTRLVAGLFILKHMHYVSDDVLCARWIENPYYQYFRGELSFCHRLRLIVGNRPDPDQLRARRLRGQRQQRQPEEGASDHLHQIKVRCAVTISCRCVFGIYAMKTKTTTAAVAAKNKKEEA